MRGLSAAAPACAATSSRAAPARPHASSSYGGDDYTVGVLVQANFGARRELTIAGIPLGDALADDNPMGHRYDAPPPGAGSIIAVIATDAPLLPGQCKALARRVPLGLARTGTTGSHFSGDLFVAFSTANADAFTPGWRALRGERQGSYDTLRFIPWGFLDTFYEAVVRSVEEAVLNALVANEEMIGYRGRRVPALPREKIAELVKARPSPV